MIHRLMRRRFNDARNETIWLTIYADLITNLALVFLALYGLTIMGEDALTRAIQSMKLEDISAWTEGEIPESSDFDGVTLMLKKAIAQRPGLTITQDASAVRIELGEGLLFESGRSNLKKTADLPLKELADVLRIIPYTIVIEGHTDSVPVAKGGRYKDNWELSLDRAMSIVRHMTAEHGLPANQLAAAAYGPHRPRASNMIESGRRMNRRVEIALFKDFPYDLLPKKAGDKIPSSEETNGASR